MLRQCSRLGLRRGFVDLLRKEVRLFASYHCINYFDLSQNKNKIQMNNNYSLINQYNSNMDINRLNTLPTNNLLKRFYSTSYPEHEVVGLPALSPTMESGQIVSWNVQEGEAFSAGDVICEVQTDKATVAFEATDDGYIAKILIEAGTDTIEVGTPIMVTVEEEDDVNSFGSFTVSDTTTSSSSGDSSSSDAPPPPPPPPAAPTTPTPTSTPTQSTSNDDRVFISPLARKLAENEGYNVSDIQGTGPGGRIIAADISEYVPSIVQQVHETTGEIISSNIESSSYFDTQLSEQSRQIAQQLTQNKQEVPHFYLNIDLNLEKLMELRTELNNKLGSDQISVNDFIIKAAAKSMESVPAANSSWHNTYIRTYNDVDINYIMYSGETLLIPVLRGCQNKGLEAISNNTLMLEEQLESNEISSEFLQKGTFTIMNYGSWGIRSCQPIIHSPQATALALGQIEDRVLPNDNITSEDDEIYKIVPMMTATLSCDHRVVDGAVGAQWLQSFRKYIEDPVTLLL